MSRKSTWLLLLALGGSGFAWWQTRGDESDQFGLPGMDDVRNMEPKTKSVPGPPQAKLKLNVKVGDRFPLLKSVEQELTQFTDEGKRQSRSALQLLLAITVDDIAQTDRKPILAGSRLLSVRYQSVRYQHDIAGRHVEYDSAAPQYPLADSVQAYHGLVNNGFRFWLGPDNQIAQLVDFNDFLQRCVRHVPFDRRQAVFSELIATLGDDGIANFIDDSIGLLPYNVKNQNRRTVPIGGKWTRQRQVLRPVPMFLSTNYMLTDLSDRFAQISIVGDVTPGRAFGPSQQPQHDVNVTILGGRSTGNCTIDRKTGLPIKSTIERHILMNVDLGDGKEFRQKKRVVTVIRTFQHQDARPPTSTRQKTDIIQTGGESGSGRSRLTLKQLEPNQIETARP